MNLLPDRARQYIHLFLKVAAAIVMLLPAIAAAADPEEIDPKQPGDAAVRAESDDPNARHRFQNEWYETPMTPAYMKWLNDAAARERERNGALLPSVDADNEQTSALQATMSSAVVGNQWMNIGPTNANYIKNGSFVLQKTDSGRPVAIVPHPKDANVLYLATAGGGVWKTTNALAAQPTWKPLTETLGSLACGALAIDPAHPSTLYLGLGDSFDGTGIGFTKTTDGGKTWSKIVYLGEATAITAIAVSQDDSNRIIAATDHGLFTSTNGGATFKSVKMGHLTEPYCWSIAWTGGKSYVLSLEADHDALTGTTGGQVWYSSDDGTHWDRAAGIAKPSGIGRLTVAASPAEPSILYAEAAKPNDYTRTDLADFFRSQDGGHSWQAMDATVASVHYTNKNPESPRPATILNGQGWYNQLVIPDRTDSGTVMFGGALLLARATNALEKPAYEELSNWLAKFGLPYVHADFHCAAYDAEGNLYVGTDGGIFRSSNNGNSWTDKLNVGIVSHLLYSVGSSPADPNVVIGGMQDNGTRLRKGDSSTFNQKLGGDGFASHVHASHPGQMLGSLYYTRIFKSKNGGSSFSSASAGIVEAGNGKKAPFNTHIVPWLGAGDGNVLFTHVNAKVYKTTNYAEHWNALGKTGLLPEGGVLRNIGVAKSSDQVLGAVASSGRVFLSANGGDSWTESLAAALPGNGYSLSYISFDPTNPSTVYVASVALEASYSHLWQSTDQGATWHVMDTAPGFPTGVPVNAIVPDPNSADTLYAATHLGVYRSQDGGGHWERFGAKLPLVNVYDFYIAPNSKEMLAATYGRGFWRLTKR